MSAHAMPGPWEFWGRRLPFDLDKLPFDVDRLLGFAAEATGSRHGRGHGGHHHGHHHGHRHGPRGGSWLFGKGFPGPGFGRGPKVGRGDVREALLALLAERPMHGYQMISELTERSGGMWRPSPGSVYPVLSLLADEGLVRAEEADGRRVYHLTEAGRAHVEARAGEPKPWETAAAAADDGMAALHTLAFGVGAAVVQVAQAGTEAQIAAAKTVLAEARRSLYRILAGDLTDPAEAAGPEGPDLKKPGPKKDAGGTQEPPGASAD